MHSPNFEYLDTISFGCADFKQKIIAIIKKEFPVEVGTYFSSIQDKNYTNAACIFHKIKHKITVLGFIEGYSIAQTYEENLYQGNAVLQRDFEKIIFLMEDFINKL